ncbi:CLUMA_CG008989, isoform A [Clunio marinus]|uniref:CLUMA_CG008989, isoform A n=1 Tax=Clunio marinus TaxID=568069 RepID=A0A1J1I5G2_9DIPT|nr:CLUMA_CG008989, isoform A [Clunio marinus]
MEDNKMFVSYFKINNIPIMPPIIDQKLRDEIKNIREIVKTKEKKWLERKEIKDRQNAEKQNNNDDHQIDSRLGSMGPRRGSYILNSPIFASTILPQINIESSESDKDTVVDGQISLMTEDTDLISLKTSKDLQNEIDKRSGTPASSAFESIEAEVNNQLRDLIDKQKREYLQAMEVLKNKFKSEQQQLLLKLQTDMIPVTSTPMENNSLMTCTDDEEFTNFKTCLQTQSSLEEKTITNENDVKIEAANIINAYTRGYLTRRLMQTLYVQDHIRNIKETLHLVVDLQNRDEEESPMQNNLLKLFQQLQTDLLKFHEIFFNYSIKDKMKVISIDRDMKLKKAVEENDEHLSLSFTEYL